jgi:hypothetical protein
MRALTFPTAALVALALTTTAPAQHEHAKHFDKCAKACDDCKRECDSCFHHCAHLVADGKKDHARSMKLCVDCAEVCSTAGRLSARHSALSVIACEACAKACDVCAEECEKHKGDKHMAACAKACRDCANECREMVKHVGEKK